jgi:hypothetical protein
MKRTDDAFAFGIHLEKASQVTLPSKRLSEKPKVARD